MVKIYPCLWFNGNSQEGAQFYRSVFSNSKITAENHFVSLIEIEAQKIMCLNGGPEFKPNPSISFFVIYESMDEVEQAWAKLTDGGTILMPLDKYAWSEKYGWVQDKFGFSWQLALGKFADVGQKFTPTLMFTGDNAGKAEHAIQFYTSLFDNSSVAGILRYGANEEDKEGLVKHAQFKIRDYVMMVMDSSHPHGFTFNEAISLVVECDTQDEIDYHWNRLTEDGEESMCGWLKDKYGVSWQVVPSVLGKLMSDENRAPGVIQAFMKMKKFNIAELENA